MINKENEKYLLKISSKNYRVLNTKGLYLWFNDLLQQKKKQDEIISIGEAGTYTDGYLNYKLVLPPAIKYGKKNRFIFIETRDESITYRQDKDYYLRIRFPEKSMNKHYTEYWFMNFFNSLAVHGQPNLDLFLRETKDGEDRDPDLVKLVNLLADGFGIKGFGFNKHPLKEDGIKFDYEKFMAGELH